jgi:hypothetical protein
MIGTEEPKKVNNAKPRADQLLDTYRMHKGLRSNFESYWQSLHDYFYIEAEDVNTTYYPGTELNASYLYDSTTLESADVLASGFMNYLTPPTSKWFGLTPKNPKNRANKAICKFLEDCTDEVNYALNKSNFYNQIIASYKGSGVYGTSILIEEEDLEDDIRFNSLAIKNVVLVEDGRGRVVQYFIEFEYTARQAESKWGRKALARPLQEELESGSEKANKHLFLLYIATRHAREVQKSDKKNMPIEAVWIDQESRVIIDESGYNEFPAFCHRFDKRPSIVWGFSPGMKTLPFARILNAIAKTNLRAMMKATDPAIALPDNAFIMPFNQNPRAINYYNKKIMDRGAADLFTLQGGANPEVGMQALEYYTNRVKAMMYNDVFLAFDAIDKRMNNPEVMERINEKMTMLGPAVGRYVSEMLNPAIIRTLGILARRGRLPKPPVEFMMDPDYEIDCVSQLAQAQRRSELNALVGGLTIVSQMAQFAPQVTDAVDPDKVVNEVWAITGAPDRVLRDDAEIAQLRQVRGQMAKQQHDMQMAQQGAATVKDGSQVDLNVAKAKAHTGIVPQTRAQ